MGAKGTELLGDTRTRILELLRVQDRSAPEIARALGIQVSAARKHLERLRALGIAAHEFRRQARGRPSKRYVLTDEGKELFPRRYDAVLNSLISALVEERGEAYVESIMGRTARESVPSKEKARTARDRLRSLLDSLNDLGFEASAKREGRAYVITSRNCPLLRTASKHGELVCRGLHAALIGLALGVDVARERWILHGDPVCTHRAPLGECRPGSRT